MGRGWGQFRGSKRLQVGPNQSSVPSALYTLSEGEFVSYILSAPDFVTRPFRDLFAGGLPLMTPLVARSEGPPGDR